MSLAFAPTSVRQGPPPNRSTIQKLLDENSQLIQAIAENQNLGRLQDCLQLQEKLHRNLVYLASIADAGQSLLAELQIPPGNNSASGSGIGVGIDAQGRRNVPGNEISTHLDQSQPQNPAGPQNFSQSQNPAGPQNFSQSQNFSQPQNPSGPQNFSQPQNSTGPMGQPLQNIQNIPPTVVNSAPPNVQQQYGSHPQHQQMAYQPVQQQQMNPQTTHYTYYQQQPGPPPPPVQQQRYQHPGGYAGYSPAQQAQMQQPSQYQYQQGQTMGYGNYSHPINPGQQSHQTMQPGPQMQMQTIGYGGPPPTNNPGPPQH